VNGGASFVWSNATREGEWREREVERERERERERVEGRERCTCSLSSGVHLGLSKPFRENTEHISVGFVLKVTFN
jgi:hypothetical protein